jgi:superfamily II DNA or RNA helicase
MTSKIIPRPRQKVFVDRCCDALDEHSNTLGVANTGFGKTIALSMVADQRINGDKKALVMAHRDELTRQNSDKYRLVNPRTTISFFNAEKKSFRGRVVFSMVQTLSQEQHLKKLPHFDLLVIDECHHAASDSYRRVISRAAEVNSKIEILGVTATPERTDNRGLRHTFTNVADVVTIGEMVRAGHLVPPKAMVVDIGTQAQLQKIRKSHADFDQAEVEAIQNTTYNNDQIVSQWLKLAKDRPTVVFTSTIDHTEDVVDAFRNAGVDAEGVHSRISMGERRETLERFDRGDLQVLVNPMILTEGWDSQVCSCVVLLRESSHKSVVIQMVGRGLRKVDPNIYPGVIKRDCLVLDFGISLLTHGNLEAEIRLKDDGAVGEATEAKKKNCPECKAELPVQTRTCPLCGYEFKVELIEGYYDEIAELKMIELELINNSPFRWISLWDSEKILIANGFEAWACVASPDGENYFAIGGKGKDVQGLGVFGKNGAVGSADDFMRQNETSRNAKKAAGWQKDPATQKQLDVLSKFGMCRVMTKAEAGAYLTFFFNRKTIERMMGINV